jgi:hypothetical protein
VAISWGPDRIDVFAVFKDKALWHRWWDGQIWNEWENLGGDYVGEPAAVSSVPGRIDVFATGTDGALHHHVFSGDSWTPPQHVDVRINPGNSVVESPTVVSTAANRLELFVPVADRQIRRGEFDGQTWSWGSTGASFRLPGRYRISVDFVRADRARALNNDTAAASMSVKAGNRPVLTRTQWLGEIGGSAPDELQTNLLDVDNVSVDLAEPMSFSYLVVNNGHAPKDKILAALANAGDSLSLAGSSSMQEDIGKGIAKIIAVKIVDLLTGAVPVVGSALKILGGWLMDRLIGAVFEDCDGLTAVEMRAMMGRDLFELTDNGQKTVRVTTQHDGTDAGFFCGRDSRYKVTWSIKPL